MGTLVPQDNKQTYDGNVGHKATVHNVHMDPVTACFLNLLDLQARCT